MQHFWNFLQGRPPGSSGQETVAFAPEVCYTEYGIYAGWDPAERPPHRLPIQKGGGAPPRGGRCAEVQTGGRPAARGILCAGFFPRHRARQPDSVRSAAGM